MLCQLAMATFHMPMAMAAMPDLAIGTDADASNSFPQTIIICTGYGLKRITIDADGNPVDAGTPISSNENCSLCSTACDLTSDHVKTSPPHILQALSLYRFFTSAKLQDRTPEYSNGHDPPHQI